MILAPVLLAASAAATPAAAPPARALAPDAAIRAAAEKIVPQVVAVRRDLHAHPELSNREERTGRLVAEKLRALGLEVRHPVARTGVVGVLRGARPGRVVALRADMDALPVAEKNDVPYRSTVEGVMHACGHDAHTAMLLGAAEVLASLRATLPGTVVFLFQPAEEGAPAGEKGGAALMVEEGVLDAPKVEAVFGLHVGGWAEAGQAGWSDGAIFASSDTFAIEVAGQTVHGAEPWKGIDPVPVAAEIVQALQLVVSRQVDGRQPRVLTIGTIQGGSRFNIIAERVRMEGTIRTHDAGVRALVKERMARTVEHVAAAHGTTATLGFYDEGNPPTVNDAALAGMAVPVLGRVFGAGAFRVAPQMVAEDFPSFGKKAPYFYFLLGTRSDARGIPSTNHTATFDVDEAALPLGVRALATLAWEFAAGGTPPAR
jgi:amidohydrolase